jgi:predicted ATPase
LLPSSWAITRTEFFGVDLTSIETPDLVPSKVADVLGVETRPEDVLSDLMAALKDMDVLLVLDNCEHLVPPLPP